MPNPTVFPDNPNDPVNRTHIFGQIKPPPIKDIFITEDGGKGQGIFNFVGLVINLATIFAGLFVLIQFIMAGYDFISANGDEKKVASAWAKIWQSVVGIAIIASAFVLIAVVERITGINIRNPVIYAP